jgi:hypothetical protein
MLNETVWTTGEGARFSARTVAVLSSDRVLDSKEGSRPLLLAVLADAGAARPIAACVRLRGELEVGSGKYALLRSAGYRQTAQHVAGGGATILQWSLPGYFELDPGARADGGAADEDVTGGDEKLAAGAAAFVVMPAAAALAREVAARDPAEVDDVIGWLTRDTTVLSGRYGSGEDRFKIPSPSDPPYLQTGAPVARAARAEAVAWAPLRRSSRDVADAARPAVSNAAPVRARRTRVGVVAVVAPVAHVGSRVPRRRGSRVGRAAGRRPTRARAAGRARRRVRARV